MNITSRRFDVRHDAAGNPTEVAFVCPGCSQYHTLRTEHADGGASPLSRDDGPRWRMEGTAERPTMVSEPPSSLCVAWAEYELDDDDKPINVVDHTCHFTVEDGVIKFSADCTHHLAGHDAVPVMMHRSESA